MRMVSDVTSPGLAVSVVQPETRELTLIVLEGPDLGRFFVLDSGHSIIGRAPDCRIRLEAPGVSRRHAAVWRENDGQIWIRDLRSKFGVWVEGVRIHRVPISDGVRIQLSSDTVLLVRECDPRENQLLEQLKEAAMTDELTGVYSRRYVLARLEEEISFAERHASRLGILMIDVDNFKELNDRYGHHAGDEALRHAASLLRRAIRNEDVLGRYGGDEFLLLARDLGPERVLQLGQRLSEVVAKSSGPGDLQLTLSIGAISFDPSEKEIGTLDLVLRADAALYASKARGKNMATLWNPMLRDQMMAKDNTRATIETPLDELE